MRLTKNKIGQEKLQELLESFPLIPSIGIIGLSRNEVENSDEIAEKNVSLKSYLTGIGVGKLSASARLGISYDKYTKTCFASPVVSTEFEFRFLKNYEVYYDKLPSIDEFLKNQYFTSVEFSIAEQIEEKKTEIGQLQWTALKQLFGKVRNAGFKFDHGYLYCDEDKTLIASVEYDLDLIKCYMRDDADNGFCKTIISIDDKQKLINWFA